MSKKVLSRAGVVMVIFGIPLYVHGNHFRSGSAWETLAGVLMIGIPLMVALMRSTYGSTGRIPVPKKKRPF